MSKELDELEKEIAALETQLNLAQRMSDKEEKAILKSSLRIARRRRKELRKKE